MKDIKIYEINKMLIKYYLRKFVNSSDTIE